MLIDPRNLHKKKLRKRKKGRCSEVKGKKRKGRTSKEKERKEYLRNVKQCNGRVKEIYTLKLIKLYPHEML